MNHEESRSARAVTAKILPAVAFSFVCYLTIGIPLAILPPYVHLTLGLSTVIAGLLVSAQYIATVMSRPRAGRMTDVLGPKRTVITGLVACALSGLFIVISALLRGHVSLAVGSLTVSRLVLGVAESMVATGATMWGIGRAGAQHTAKVISWNGVSTYGALAVGAPLGTALQDSGGFLLVGIVIAAVSLVSIAVASQMSPVAVTPGAPIPFQRIFKRVAPYGLGLALSGMGFGVLGPFVTLYFATLHWTGAALCLSVYGVCFVLSRLLFSRTIDKYGGFRATEVSLVVEVIGLVLFSAARTPVTAFMGAALIGFGFSLVFPALGVESVRDIPLGHRGTALGAYTVFIDVSLLITGPVAGAIIASHGYAAAFFSAALASAAALVLTLALSSHSKRSHADVQQS